MKETSIIERLEIDHCQLLRKINFLETQYLDICRGAEPDYSLMRNIIVYIQEYPEQMHHPLEDMIFSVLLERVDDADIVQKLMSEHTRLEVVTRELRESLEALSSGTVSIEKLKKKLSDFLVGQRQHIHKEETEVYPLVKKYLTDKDWKQLQNMVSIIDEPIYGKKTRYDYERLNRVIEDINKIELPDCGKRRLKMIESENSLTV
jgi:hemerythrin-like domain-containing protein